MVEANLRLVGLFENPRVRFIVRCDLHGQGFIAAIALKFEGIGRTLEKLTADSELPRAVVQDTDEARRPRV